MKDFFLKVQYGPTSSKYFTKFTSLDFINHLDDNAAIVNVTEENDYLLFNDEYLDEEKGCSKHEDRKDCYYVNSVKLEFTPEDKPIILFTGTAYLCNSDGKTVDILR